MTQPTVLDIIRSTGVIAILRAKSSEQLLRAAEALHAGGISAIEVALTTPGALEVIAQAAARFQGSGVAFGAGTVLDAHSARNAIQAGAQFIVAPNFKPVVIKVCRRYAVPVLPGAYTPTEIVAAWEAGADMVKVFPASVGGPGFIQALKSPLPQVALVPVGGVTLENAAAFIRAGASAIGVGSELVDAKTLASQAWDALAERAGRFITEVQRARLE